MVLEELAPARGAWAPRWSTQLGLSGVFCHYFGADFET